MRDLLNRLFGIRKAGPPTPAESSLEERTGANEERPAASQPNATSSSLTGEAVISRYFELSGIIESAKADGNFVGAISAARETYPLLAAVVRQMKSEWGSFDITTSHAVHTASALMGIMSDRQGIQELREALSLTPELHRWLYIADEAEADAMLVDAILAAVAAQPAMKQTDLKRRIDADGPRLSTLAYWLERAGRLRRIKEGVTYLLYAADYPVELVCSDHASSPVAANTSNLIAMSRLRAPRRYSPGSARMVDLRTLPYVRLPKAPAVWEERHRAKGDADSPFHAEEGKPSGKRKQLPRFLAYGDNIELLPQEALPKNDRPDPAFNRMFTSEGSTLWIDSTGKRAGFPSGFPVALTTDKAGTKIAERALAHDVYRADLNADGSGMLFLSRDGILHGYSDRLEPILYERLADIPEYVAQSNRFGLASEQLKSHTRCVAISADSARYLVTVVDEAWCYESSTGAPIWGLRFPLKDGWKEVTCERSERAGPSDEIQAALRLMELSLPVTPEAITRQYRLLAMRWHPDLNPHDPQSTRKFQELGAAMELLTGANLSQLSVEQIERVTYEQLLHENRFELPDGRALTITFSVHLGGALGADWIYAANFARNGHSTFLAGYSGRILEIDASGVPLRIYDIGSVPRRIVESSSHRYIITDTRLYVLRGAQLEALIDLFDPGNLVIGDAGFGLLQPRRVQWYTTTGKLLGEVCSRDPIRRIYYGPKGLIIETRTHRAIVRANCGWW